MAVEQADADCKCFSLESPVRIMRRIEQPLVLAEGQYPCVQTGVYLSVLTCRDRGQPWMSPSGATRLVCETGCVVLCLLFWLFLFGGPVTQLPNKSQGDVTVTYKCLTLAWFVTSQIFLTYPVYLLLLDFYLSLFYMYISLPLTPWLAVCLGG